MDFAQTALLFFVVLSVLVFAHELGHFVMAKRAGIKVQEFGFGYPPRVFGIRRGETIYSINLLPLGGFVKMLGETGSAAEPRSFASKSKRTRAVVLAAGSTMNLVLAALLFSGAIAAGEPVPCLECGPVAISNVAPDTPAKAAGVQPGDVFVSIEGQRIENADAVRRAVRAAGDREIQVVVRRDGNDVTLRMTPHVMAPDNQPMIGVGLRTEYTIVRHPVWEALPLGIKRTGETLVLFFDGIKQMITREQPAELAGPVGIANMTGQAAEAGFSYLLNFTAFLSLNLAIFNMLPFPGLDGARLAFVALEGARGRRVNPQVEGVIHFVGLMLLITLMVYVSFNDVRRLVVPS
jgi:regulator of sigma E protease